MLSFKKDKAMELFYRLSDYAVGYVGEASVDPVTRKVADKLFHMSDCIADVLRNESIGGDSYISFKLRALEAAHDLSDELEKMCFADQMLDSQIREETDYFLNDRTRNKKTVDQDAFVWATDIMALLEYKINGAVNPLGVDSLTDYGRMVWKVWRAAEGQKEEHGEKISPSDLNNIRETAKQVEKMVQDPQNQFQARWNDTDGEWKVEFHKNSKWLPEYQKAAAWIAEYDGWNMI